MLERRAIRDAFGKALVELGNRDSRVIVLDADVSKSTKTSEFASEFPSRFFNMGIAEGSLLDTGAGLALSGLIPFVSTFSFLAALRAADQIRSSIAYPGLNVKIAAGYGGLSDSYDGASHHSICDLAVIRSIPNMTLVVVADAVETELAVPAVASYPGPVYLRLSRAEVPVIFDKTHRFEIGKGELLVSGKDVTLIACGVMVAKALEAAQILAGRGIEARVIEIHTLKPIDRDIIIEAAEETGAIVTAEEHSVIGGLGSAVAEVVGQMKPVPIEMVGINDVFAESGGYEELLEAYGLSAHAIVDTALKALNRNQW